VLVSVEEQPVLMKDVLEKERYHNLKKAHGDLSSYISLYLAGKHVEVVIIVGKLAWCGGGVIAGRLTLAEFLLQIFLSGTLRLKILL
jgi:hypothetical protein